MNWSKYRLSSWLLASIFAILTLLTSCGLPQITAQERVFLNLSLDFLGEYQLPKTTFQDTLIGGLSGITYDRQRNCFYAISDDRSKFAPARFYTLKLVLNDSNTGKIGIQKVEVENVTFLRDQDGKTYPQDTTDTEGIALTPQKSVFIASEGIAHNGIPPFVNEFDLQTGRLQQSVPIPERYIPDATAERGIQNNLGFESLTINPTGTIPAKGEPFRLFTATESALVQDKDPPPAATRQENSVVQGPKSRLLHYLISDGPPIPISEHTYQLEPPPLGAIKHGLADLLALDQAGHFLSLERSVGFLGFTVRIYQAAIGGATDTSQISSLKGELKGIEPVKKKLLLDLDQLKITLDNLEGMALGPRLPDGTQSLLVVSDNNFNDVQMTQFLLFSLKKGR